MGWLSICVVLAALVAAPNAVSAKGGHFIFFRNRPLNWPRFHNPAPVRRYQRAAETRLSDPTIELEGRALVAGGTIQVGKSRNVHAVRGTVKGGNEAERDALTKANDFCGASRAHCRRRMCSYQPLEKAIL